MIVLHAGFIDELHLWGECPAAVRSGRKRPPPYPFGAGSAELCGILHEHLRLSGGRSVFQALAKPLLAWIPTGAGGQPFPSSGLIAEPPAGSSGVEVKPWAVITVPLSPALAILFLSECVNRQTLSPGIVVGQDLAFWASALRFAGNLVARQQFLPDAITKGSQWQAVWKPVLMPPDRDRLQTLAGSMPAAARCLAAHSTNPPTTSAVSLLHDFLGQVVDELVRSSGDSPQVRSKVHSLHDRWRQALTSPDRSLEGEPLELLQLGQQVREWRRPMAAWLDAPLRLCFRLEEPADDADPWFVRYLLQGSRDPSLQVDAAAIWSGHKASAAALRHPDFEPRQHLLLSLGQASGICPEIDGSLKRSSAPAGYHLDATGANSFLLDRAISLEQAGFAVQLPSWWTRKGTKNKLTAGAHVKTSFTSKSGLSLNQLVDVEWSIAIGGEPISMEELKALAALKAPLVRFRGQWIQMSAEEIKVALDFWKKRPNGKTALRDIVQMALGKPLEVRGLELGGITAEGWVGDLLDQLKGKTSFAELAPPQGLNATLRPYQQRGYSWLAFLRRWGLGACLADDMGLGKTIQTLSLLEAQRADGEKRPVLLVCPTSVVGNWQKEAARFTPGLPVLTHHGLTRAKGDAFVRNAGQHGLVISSYALLHRDFEILKNVEWAGLVLDEAQNIKNSGTRQANAARALPAEFRIALTGTPVENNVGDLWSIMEFLNPGLLGSQPEFKRNFFVPIQTDRDPEASERLRKLTGPFILRRLKTDKSIISDLPDKLEMKVFCTLTREQASLYQAVVQDSLDNLSGSDGIKRKGMVLAALSKLKQVCNHPAQFLGDNSAIAGRSGKLARLGEMLEEVLSAGDRALVFTQFAEMGEIIRRHLQETFGREVPFLHGGSSKTQRDSMVERFQGEGGPSIFLLSLKAGGSGITLTRANHVFHFDRWWNPAVENQATDRAFRIGQSKNVQVHKFLCAGTLEERIDEMIESKKQIAENVVSAGEQWLTELSTAELKDLFALRKEAVSE